MQAMITNLEIAQPNMATPLRQKLFYSQHSPAVEAKLIRLVGPKESHFFLDAGFFFLAPTLPLATAFGLLGGIFFLGTGSSLSSSDSSSSAPCSSSSSSSSSPSSSSSTFTLETRGRFLGFALALPLALAGATLGLGVGLTALAKLWSESDGFVILANFLHSSLKLNHVLCMT